MTKKLSDLITKQIEWVDGLIRQANKRGNNALFPADVGILISLEDLKQLREITRSEREAVMRLEAEVEELRGSR